MTVTVDTAKIWLDLMETWSGPRSWERRAAGELLPIRITGVHCVRCVFPGHDTIEIIHCAMFCPRVGWPGHPLFDRQCCKIVQGLGPLGRKSYVANWEYDYQLRFDKRSRFPN